MPTSEPRHGGDDDAMKTNVRIQNSYNVNLTILKMFQ